MGSKRLGTSICTSTPRSAAAATVVAENCCRQDSQICSSFSSFETSDSNSCSGADLNCSDPPKLHLHIQRQKRRSREEDRTNRQMDTQTDRRIDGQTALYLMTSRSLPHEEGRHVLVGKVWESSGPSFCSISEEMKFRVTECQIMSNSVRTLCFLGRFLKMFDKHNRTRIDVQHMDETSSLNHPRWRRCELYRTA